MNARAAALVLGGALASCASPAPLANGAAVRSSLPALASARADLQTRAVSTNCQGVVVRTASRLEACIREPELWQYLSQFQSIADEHPGDKGHGNRDTGTAGYAASVAYVAGLLRHAGYAVTIQSYPYAAAVVAGAPAFYTSSRAYEYQREWYVARRSAAGTIAAEAEPPAGSIDGCAAGDFSGFTRGDVAVLARSSCAADTQVENAQAAGASAVVLYSTDGSVFEARLTEAAAVPVVGVAAPAVGEDLVTAYRSQRPATVHIDVRTQAATGVDYNLIADSPYGDPQHVVVVDAHLDSIYGAGMLDNASGSTTALDIALNLAATPTKNALRYIFFGGEELGLLGSKYYTTHLTERERKNIAFDVDIDVTATPNYDILIADPADAWNAQKFPKNVVPQSAVGNAFFADYYRTHGIVFRQSWFGNGGTDSNSFSLAGIPNTGVLTQQDCCKQAWETAVWGGSRGNYEGLIPSFNGGCVDMPNRWCDNLGNNDPAVLETTSKATANVVFRLAQDATLP